MPPGRSSRSAASLLERPRSPPAAAYLAARRISECDIFELGAYTAEPDNGVMENSADKHRLRKIEIAERNAGSAQQWILLLLGFGGSEGYFNVVDPVGESICRQCVEKI